MFRFPVLLTLTALLAIATCSPHAAHAVKPSEQLLPNTTKGYLAIPDMDVLLSKWKETQLGLLMKHPAMKPFSKDLQRQLNEKLAKTGVKLGLSLADLEGVSSGEVCLAAILPGGDPTKHASAMLADITGKRKEADELLKKIEADLRANEGRRKDLTISDVPVIKYTVPRKKGEMRELQHYYAIVDNMLIAVDDEGTTKEILGRLVGEVKDKEILGEITAFKSSMAKCKAAAGAVKPHIRWFVEPFGYARYSRASSDEKKKRGKDMLKILEGQGFDAVQGLGGYVTLMVDGNDFLHRSYVYAPPVPDAPAPNRYRLAANMLQFPNIDAKTENLLAQSWVGDQVGSYTTFKWEMQKAFWASETLVDDVVGAKGSFQDVMKALKHDPAGPQIDVPSDLVNNLSDRASMMTDYELPITTESERWLAAVKIIEGKEAVVKKLVDKAMEHDPDALARKFNGHIIWEVIKEEDEDLELMIDGPAFPGFDPVEEEAPAGDDEPMIPNSAATVANGHLIVASHVDIIKNVLTKKPAEKQLTAAKDYRTIQHALAELGAGNDSFRVFARTDETYRPTYELLRQGKMPESKTMFGKLLNRMFAPDEEGAIREQKIDGSKMPAFEIVKDFLGPAGVYVRSYDDGWMATGCLLVKEAKAAAVAEKKDAKASGE